MVIAAVGRLGQKQGQRRDSRERPALLKRSIMYVINGEISLGGVKIGWPSSTPTSIPIDTVEHADSPARFSCFLGDSFDFWNDKGEDIYDKVEK